ncbi:MAG: hypothetical protein DKINENOH_00304 [bacterium]|nr:hypothetical protein [bacterium]
MQRMGLQHWIFKMLCVSFLALGYATEVRATDVTLRLVDQNGALIPASQFTVLTPPGGTVQNGGMISLADGSYTIRLLPGLNGSAQTGYLYRDESVFISGSAQTIESVWVTATLQVNIIDQNNVPIPESQFAFFNTPIIPNGNSLVLPVTEDPSSTLIEGSFADGHLFTIYPGLDGAAQRGFLQRQERIEHLATGTVANLVWITATLQINIIDQNNVPIPESQFAFFNTPIIPNGGSLVLPVTEDPSSTLIEGSFADGHLFTIYPGLDGAAQRGFLQRQERIEHLATGTVANLVWITATLQINIIDQNNVPIPESQFAFFNTPIIPNGGSLVLPVTEDPSSTLIEGSFADGHLFTIYPGLDGVAQRGFLQRQERIEHLATGTVANLVWITATLQINIIDQNNVPIPESQFAFFNTPIIPNGGSLVLPVTEDPSSTLIEGSFADGHLFTIYPGLDGVAQRGFLQRQERIEHLATGTVANLVWITATLQINIIDQNNVPIPESQFAFFNTPIIPNGGSLVLPVTEDPSSTLIEGNFRDGYFFTIYPGLDGAAQRGYLQREETVELITTGMSANFVWEISKGTLHVVNATEAEVNGSSIRQGFLGTINTGTCFSLPITDNAAYPTIAGRYANGYDDFYIQTASANPFEGPFTFKFLSNKIIDPAFVTLASGQHGLRFDLMTPTALAAHAGSDQTINAGQAVQIGGSPTATGGSGSYTISWSPEDGLDDPSAANPMASPASTTTYMVTVTDNATGCQARDEVAVQVNHVDPIKPFVFLANKITLKRTKQHTPAGDMHANGVITIEKGDPSIYNSNFTAVGNVVIQKDNTINGNVKSATKITNQGKINGTPSIAPVNNEPLPSKSFSAGGSNHIVPQNGVLNLSPNTYGLVTLNSFSTLKLTSGDYYLDELRYASTVTSAVIEIDLSSRNPVTINVANNLQLGNEVEIRLLPNGESDSKLVTFFTLQNSAVKFGRGAYLLGSINAPNALLTLQKNSQLRGTICAKELLVERDCLFLHHDAPGSLPGPGDLPKSSSDEEVIGDQLSVVSDYALEQNYPNPFNPSTTIAFALPKLSEVTLKIFDASGREVKTLVEGRLPAGRHEVVLDASPFSSGVYFYRLQAGEFSQTRRLTLVK